MDQQELRVVRTYFVRGAVPKGWRFRPSIRRPPTSGFGLAVILTNKRSSIIFSPFTLEASMVPNDCGEIAWAEDLLDLVDLDYSKVADTVERSWKKFSGLGMQKDYGVAATVLKLLGRKPPIEDTPGTLRAAKARKAGKSGGGKPVAEVTKPLRPNTKRAKVAKFFEQPALIQQAMHELDLTRSGVLSHLHCIHKYNGFGYRLTGDSAELVVPEGAELFDEEGG